MDSPSGFDSCPIVSLAIPAKNFPFWLSGSAATVAEMEETCEDHVDSRFGFTASTAVLSASMIELFVSIAPGNMVFSSIGLL